MPKPFGFKILLLYFLIIYSDKQAIEQHQLNQHFRKISRTHSCTRRVVNYKNKKLISDPHNYGGYKQRSKDEGLSEKDAHSSGYVNTKINTLQYTYEVPELTKSFLVHENSHQFHQ